MYSQSSVTWTNVPSETTFSPGQELEMILTYNTIDLDYICIWVREVNNNGETVNDYGAFTTCPLSGSPTDTHPNSGSINYVYSFPPDIPNSNTLSTGNFYKMIIFLFDDTGISSNASVDITISSTTTTSKVTAILNAKHSVGGIETFERTKFITIHANQTENEWNGDNFTTDLKNHFLNGYDVYMGRDTGGITWYLNNVQEDPLRPGFADPSHIESLGQNRRNFYASQTGLHAYEARNNLIVGAQKNPFWTGNSQIATGRGWKLSNATATGEYMGRYINAFYGENGPPMPSYIEVINEPAYHDFGGPDNYTNSIEEIADFHNEVAIAIKALLPNAKVGGYTTAFPNFEKGDFQRWNNRWKLFMDIAGNNMDFWSIHLYDFPSINGGKKILRSGSNIEATFDMMEQYSFMSFGFVKPFVISEYGAQMHDYATDTWSPFRDWLHLKAQNAQLFSFMERPNYIASAINFLPIKAEWGYNTSNNVPYNHRLMRKANEPNSYTGNWVYTDMVKFYQLWSNVKGTRIDTFSDNLDIQVDGYVDGNTVYLILNNLNFTNQSVDLALFETQGATLSTLTKKHLYLNENNNPVLLEESIPVTTNSVILNAESTMILEFSYNTPIIVNESKTETKFYATSYLKPISAFQTINFEINGVSKNIHGEAILRIGLGRSHDLSLSPTVKINGSVVEVPNNWRGDSQLQRERFFGILEIPIPFNLLQTNNTISLEFNDSGGHVSTAILQLFNFSSDYRDIVLNNAEILTSQPTTIFPNPNQGIIRFNNEISTNDVIHIFDTKGVELKTYKGGSIIDISNLQSGIYILKTDNGLHAKIIKN